MDFLIVMDSLKLTMGIIQYYDAIIVEHMWIHLWNSWMRINIWNAIYVIWSLKSPTPIQQQSIDQI